MNFLRYRSEHLADFLRDALARGELTEPFLGGRSWSRQLGVSRLTLTQALQKLEREGWLVTTRHGVRLRRRQPPRAGQTPRVVRALYDRREYPQWQVWRDWPTLLAERLRAHHVELVVEHCDPPRLRAILESPATPNELLLLLSLSTQRQRLFARAGRAAVIIGSPAPGVELPAVTVDQDAAFTHATLSLLRDGCQRVTLVSVNTRAPGIRQAASIFTTACRRWPHQPIRSEVVLLPRRFSDQLVMARRLAARATPRQGFIVTWPVHTSLIMTALLQRGLTVPDQAPIISMLAPAETLVVCPPPPYYPFPQARFIKALAEITLHYFETGRLPPGRKLLPVELVRPSSA